ncbi:MAG: 4-(cytidine 5'-diphospho)-2-C-methyl-D-erythritol kinase [Eubacterium sp.]|nr:4-(cytidine 5'-diphospho)-2-C-methyl-D-erythritol kinase [Eubacterium sp.]
MKIEAQAKINLALDVTGKRADGYHLVRMVMQSIQLSDLLEIEKTKESGIRLQIIREQDSAADSLPANPENLAWKGAALLLGEFRPEGGVSMKLTKRIPVAAGLAGGSTDAAAAMIGVNKLFCLGLSGEELAGRSAAIGADVPFCIRKGTMLAEGIGEKLTGLPQMPDCTILIAKPPVEVSTPHVYKELDKRKEIRHPDLDAMIRALEEADLYKVASLMGNVLADVTESELPEIIQIRRLMMEGGAIGAMMSGSGPSVFGIFSERDKAEKTAENPELLKICRDIIATKPYN